jgi:hypothetical protein
LSWLTNHEELTLSTSVILVAPKTSREFSRTWASEEASLGNCIFSYVV